MHEPDDAGLQALKALLARSRGLEHAPEQLLEQVIDAFDVPRRSPITPPLRRLLAALSFDELGSALSPVRASRPATRRLIFNAGEIDVSLAITPGSRRGSWRIEGQCLGDDGPGHVALSCADQHIEAEWSPQCEFDLDPVPPGQCELVLRTLHWAMTLPSFELPPPG
jgi:hypothetical protein